MLKFIIKFTRINVNVKICIIRTVPFISQQPLTHLGEKENSSGKRKKIFFPLFSLNLLTIIIFFMWEKKKSHQESEQGKLLLTVICILCPEFL